MLNNAEDVKNCCVNLIKSSEDYLKRSISPSAELTTAIETLGAASHAVELAIDAAVATQAVQAEIKADPAPMPVEALEMVTPVESDDEVSEFMKKLKTNPEACFRAMRKVYPKAWDQLENALLSIQ